MKKDKSKRNRILGNFGWLTNVNDHRQHEFDKKLENLRGDDFG